MTVCCSCEVATLGDSVQFKLKINSAKKRCVVQCEGDKVSFCCLFLVVGLLIEKKRNQQLRTERTSKGTEEKED